MKLALFLFLGVLAFAFTGCVQQHQGTSTASVPSSDFGMSSAKTPRIDTDEFDFFLLNLSWSPEFCHSHPTAKECAQHRGFVLHGLWPERADGTYPENCSNAAGPSNPDQYADVYPDPGLLKHEWKTHGTCSGMGPDAYFTHARTAYRSITIPPKLAHLSAPTSLAPSDIAQLFRASNPSIPAASIAVSCGNNYLTAVEVCLDKNLHATACGSVKTCHANSVRIPSP